MVRQAERTPNPERARDLEKLNEMIDGIRIAMLVTQMPDGTLRSRPMMTQHTETDGVLWFFTALSGHKTDEIESHHEVNLAYSDPDDNRYVSISGVASVVRDEERARELWSPLYRAWFPKGLDDPQLALLRVDVHHAEFWDAPSSTMVHLAGLAKALTTGKRYERPGDHGQISFS